MSAVRLSLHSEVARDFQKAQAVPFLESPQTDARTVRGSAATTRQALPLTRSPVTSRCRPLARSAPRPCSPLCPGARRWGPPKPDFPTTRRVPGLHAGGSPGRSRPQKAARGGSRTLGCGFSRERFIVSWGQTPSHTQSHAQALGAGPLLPAASCPSPRPSARFLNGCSYAGCGPTCSTRRGGGVQTPGDQGRGAVDG